MAFPCWIMRRNFTSMNQSYIRDRTQLAVIFYAQRIRWSFKELNLQATSMATALKNQLKCIQGDSILVKYNPRSHSQRLVLKIACAHLGVKAFDSSAETQAALKEELRTSKARALFFDTYDRIQDDNMIDFVYQLVPSARLGLSKEVRSEDFRYLRYLIHNENYNFAGTHMHQNLLRLGMTDTQLLFFDCQEEPIILDTQNLLEDGNRPIFITNPLNDFVFRAAVLNCLTQGRLLFCAQPNKVRKYSEYYDHEIDLVGCEPADVHQKTRVIVETGSQLFKQCQNRVQLPK